MATNLLKIFVFVLLLSFPAKALAANDFGLDFTAGVKQKLLKDLTIGAGFELKTQHKSHELERLAIEPALSYAPLQYLKIDTGYVFIDRYIPAAVTQKGEKQEAYSSPRHRFYASLSAIWPIKNFKLSLRERYQLTHRTEVIINGQDSNGYEAQEIKKAKTTHNLRSRLMGEYNITKIGLTPFFGAELYNDLAASFAVIKVKFFLGADYLLGRQNSLGLFVEHNVEIANKNDADMTILGLTYTYRL